MVSDMGDEQQTGVTMQRHSGSCLCGAVTFEVMGNFDSFYLCHCKYCQKDSGSAHGANLFATSAQLRWLTGDTLVNQFTLAGSRHSKSFCQHCGSALPGTQLDGSLVVVPAGSLDSPVSMRPTAHLFIASKAPWESAFDDIPSYAQFPD